MSRTNKGSKGPGYDYWKSRMPGDEAAIGSEMKQRTARYERRKGKQENLENEDLESEIDNKPED